MKKRSELNLASLSLEELMEGLEAITPPAPDSVESWVAADGYYPGTTRVFATELYTKYRKWLEDNPEAGPPLAIRVWGKLMANKFKRGRSKYGSTYYISRDRL